MVDDLPPGDVGDEGVAVGAEDGEFGAGEEVCRFFCEGHADEEVVDVLAEEVVQACFVEPAVPCRGDGAIRVACAGHDETFIVFGFWRRAWGSGVGDHIHAECFGDVGDLSADGAVAEDAEALADSVFHGAEGVLGGAFAPIVVELPGVQEGVVVGVGEGCQDDPFCDLGAVDAGGGGEGDAGGGVDGGVGDVVCAGGEEVDQFCVIWGKGVSVGFWWIGVWMKGVRTEIGTVFG